MSLKKRRLGKTDLQVSEIGFGCWAIGGSGYGATDDTESLAALELAWKKGVNFYDTADTYGQGHSEALIGQFLKDKPRDEVIIASKVGWDFYHGGSKKNFEPDYIEFACDKSLERLGVDSIDLYQLHNPILEVIEKGACLDALEELKRKGKIKHIGVSIHRESEGLALIESGRVDALQLVFNLIDQKMSQRLFAAAKAADVGIIAREPLACGILTEKYDLDHVFEKDDHRRRWTKEKRASDLKKIEVLKKVLATGRISVARASLEFVLDHEEVGVVIPGIKTKKQLLENLAASTDPLLRSQESYHLREIYQREDVFKEDL